MLFDYHNSNRLLVCLDPAAIDLLQDFYADRCTTRTLEIECEFTDEYLLGHARRVGLAGERTPPEVLARLLPTIRYDVRFESDRLRDANFPNLTRLRQSASVEDNTAPLARFLSLPPETAREIAATHYLFTD